MKSMGVSKTTQETGQRLSSSVERFREIDRSQTLSNIEVI